MMNFRKTLLDWFGYSRRERRATIILLVALSIFVMVPYVLPSKGQEPVNISELLASAENPAGNNSKVREKTETLILFDPNTASFDTLLMVGFTEKQASTLVNFRNKGGRLRKPDDIKKLNGIDEETSEKLIPGIIIRNYSHKVDHSRESTSIRKKFVKIELNGADSATLIRLPGIGPVLSVRIIKYRKRIGGFASVSQLKEVYGLKEDVFLKIADRCYVDSALITRVCINTASEKELARLPYLDKADILAILKFRDLIGSIRNIQELTDNKVITAEKGRKLSPYFKFL